MLSSPGGFREATLGLRSPGVLGRRSCEGDQPDHKVFVEIAGRKDVSVLGCYVSSE